MKRLLLFLLALAACGSPSEKNESDAQELGFGGDPHANPPSARLPDRWIEIARGRSLVAIAGANAGTQYRQWMKDGWGTDDAPLRRVQSLEAVTAIYELLGEPAPTTIDAWGWGADDIDRDYVYEAIGGKHYTVRFLSHDAVAAAYGDLSRFNEEGVLADAKALRATIDAVRPGVDVMYVGCSWGGGIIDYGKTRNILGDVPGLAIASPLDLPTLMQPWPFVGLSHTGDHGDLLVVRRPDDAVGQGGLRPLKSAFAGPTHNYTLAWHGDQIPGGFWGITGEGMLCPAAFDDDCPFPM